MGSAERKAARFSSGYYIRGRKGRQGGNLDRPTSYVARASTLIACVRNLPALRIEIKDRLGHTAGPEIAEGLIVLPGRRGRTVVATL
jgi:hypothetical protein